MVHKDFGIDSDNFINSLPHAIRYKYSMWSELRKLSALINSGHEIEWSANKKWCTVNGKTFNISKSVYEKRILESELEDVFTEYYWNDDGRPMQFWCEYSGSDYETVFDFSVQEVGLKVLDAYLASIFDKK